MFALIASRRSSSLSMTGRGRGRLLFNIARQRRPPIEDTSVTRNYGVVSSGDIKDTYNWLHTLPSSPPPPPAAAEEVMVNDVNGENKVVIAAMTIGHLPTLAFTAPLSFLLLLPQHEHHPQQQPSFFFRIFRHYLGGSRDGGTPGMVSSSLSSVLSSALMSMSMDTDTSTTTTTTCTSNTDDDADTNTNDDDDGLYFISTLKRRRKKMNKHKLRKRRKKNRMKNKK